MPSLDTIYAGVVVKTGRRDRMQETKQAVIDAVIEYHSLGFFERDITTGVVTIGSTQRGVVQLRTMVPRLRKLLAVFTLRGEKVPKIPAGRLDMPGYYLVGNELHFNPPDILQQATLVICQHPEIESSWILQEYPEAVQSLAAAKVAALVGNRNLAAALFLEVGQIYPTRSGFKNKIVMENESYEPDI